LVDRGLNTTSPTLIAQVELAHDDVPCVVPLTVGLVQAACAFAPAAFVLIREPAHFAGADVATRYGSSPPRRSGSVW